MKEERPQINASKMVVGSGIAAAIFTVGSMLIFITGLSVFALPVSGGHRFGLRTGACPSFRPTAVR
jgi:hypothetical protein